MSGVSPSEMAMSPRCRRDLGHQCRRDPAVNLMTHATRARKEHGYAKIVAIDIYPTETMRQADLALQLRPGTDGALACAVMHALFRDGLSRPRLHDALYQGLALAELEARHLRDRSLCLWASAITGLGVEEIEGFRGGLSGDISVRFFRLGYGFSLRQRNGAANMHAALSDVPRSPKAAWARGGRRRAARLQRRLQA